MATHLIAAHADSAEPPEETDPLGWQSPQKSSRNRRRRQSRSRSRSWSWYRGIERGRGRGIFLGGWRGEHQSAHALVQISDLPGLRGSEIVRRALHGWGISRACVWRIASKRFQGGERNRRWMGVNFHELGVRVRLGLGFGMRGWLGHESDEKECPGEPRDTKGEIGFGVVWWRAWHVCLPSFLSHVPLQVFHLFPPLPLANFFLYGHIKAIRRAKAQTFTILYSIFLDKFSLILL